MTKTVAVALGLVFALTFVAGCGAEAALDPLATQPITTVREARSICLRFGFTQDEIDTLFIATRADRDAGNVLSQELAQIARACLTFELPLILPGGCQTCSFAIADAVFHQ